jgi:hypothetical protein
MLEEIQFFFFQNLIKQRLGKSDKKIYIREKKLNKLNTQEMKKIGKKE